MYETLLFDGTDIKSAGVQTIEVWDGALISPAPRGADQLIPFRDGEIYTAKAFEAHPVSIGLVLTPTSIMTLNDTLRTLRRLAAPDRTVSLTRRLSYTAGNEQQTCTARYLSGLDPALFQAMTNGRLVLTMRNLDGLWYGASTTIAAGTSTVLGDVRTRKMTVTVSAGTAPTVTNATNGSAFTVTGSTATPVVVDVLNQSATASGSDCSSRVSWSGTWPLQLEAGSNTLTISSGTLSVAYFPAFL